MFAVQGTISRISQPGMKKVQNGESNLNLGLNLSVIYIFPVVEITAAPK